MMKLLLILSAFVILSADLHAQPLAPLPMDLTKPNQITAFDTLSMGEEACIPLLFSNPTGSTITVNTFSAMWSWDTSDFVLRDRRSLPAEVAPGGILTMGTMCFHPSSPEQVKYTMDYEMQYVSDSMTNTNMFTFSGYKAAVAGVKESIDDFEIDNTNQTLKVKTSAEGATVEVIDMLGRTLEFGVVKGGLWQEAFLRPGSYILRLSNGLESRSAKVQVK